MKSKTRISYENGYEIGRIETLTEVEKMIDEMNLFRFHEYNGLHQNNRVLVKDVIERAVKFYLKEELQKVKGERKMITEDKKYKEIAEIIIDLKLISKDIKEIQSSNPIKFQAINYRINNMISKLIYEDKEIKKFIHELLKEKEK